MTIFQRILGFCHYNMECMNPATHGYVDDGLFRTICVSCMTRMEIKEHLDKEEGLVIEVQ
jgi:hypothetical protein